jgi:hypothetical protein
MSRTLATLALRVRSLRWPRAGHPVTALALAVLLAACEGGSGQSGSAFVFLTVDGFSLDGKAIVSSVPSSTAQSTTTRACVTLRNNLKNPTLTAPTSLDNVTVQSYTLTLSTGRTFTFGTAVLVPAGTVTAGNLTGNTAILSVILVPAGEKSSAKTTATAELRFRGRDGRGQSVEAEGAVTIVFESGLESDSNCSRTAAAADTTA